MNYKVIPTPRFKKEAKKLLKKYYSIKEELKQLESSLMVEPRQGIDLGGNTFKIRIAIRSKGKGKSGGGRVITFVVSDNNEIYLLSIYDKSELSTIDDKTLKLMVAEVQSKAN